MFSSRFPLLGLVFVAATSLAFCPSVHAQKSSGKKPPKASTKEKGRVVLYDHDFSYIPPQGFYDPESPRQNPKIVLRLTGPRVADGRGITLIQAIVTSIVAPSGVMKSFPPGLPSDEYVNGLFRYTIPDFLLSNKARVDLDGESALAIAGTFSMPELPGSPLQGRILFVFHNEKLYAFVFGTDAAMYDTLAPRFTKMMQSVKWLTKPKPANKPATETPGTE